jgi:hypothetical protein
MLSPSYTAAAQKLCLVGAAVVRFLVDFALISRWYCRPFWSGSFEPKEWARFYLAALPGYREWVYA